MFSKFIVIIRCATAKDRACYNDNDRQLKNGTKYNQVHYKNYKTSMKVLYANTNSILSSVFENLVQPIACRFADGHLNFAQEVSKIVWTELFLF